MVDLSRCALDFLSRARPDPSASSGVNTRLPSEAFGEGRVEGYLRALGEILQQVQDERGKRT